MPVDAIEPSLPVAHELTGVPGVGIRTTYLAFLPWLDGFVRGGVKHSVNPSAPVFLFIVKGIEDRLGERSLAPNAIIVSPSA